MQVSIAEAKAQLAALVRRAEAGEWIVLTRHGRPVARLMPPEPAGKPSMLGALAGQIEMAPDFDELPEDFLAHFSGVDHERA